MYEQVQQMESQQSQSSRYYYRTVVAIVPTRMGPQVCITKL